MQQGPHQLEYREAGPRARRVAHWWFLGALIVVGGIIVILVGADPVSAPQTRPPYHISIYLSDREVLFMRIAIVSLAVLWCGLLVAYFIRLRRTWSAA